MALSSPMKHRCSLLCSDGDASLVIIIGIDSRSMFICVLLSCVHAVPYAFDASCGECVVDVVVGNDDDADDIFKFNKFFKTMSSALSLAELTLVSELTLDERPLL